MSSKADPVFYSPLPGYSAASRTASQNYVVLYRDPAPPPFLRRCLSFAFPLLILSVALFLLWPSNPEVRILRVQLNDVAVRKSPLSLDLSLFVEARVRNRDFFSLDYDSLAVKIGYRGRKLGLVRSEGGHLKARASSYVNSTLVVDGFEVLHDIFYFIEDVAKGSVPFDTDTMVKGKLGFFSIVKIPLKAEVSCEVIVNPRNETIVRQNCYPE